MTTLELLEEKIIKDMIEFAKMKDELNNLSKQVDELIRIVEKISDEREMCKCNN